MKITAMDARKLADECHAWRSLEDNIIEAAKDGQYRITFKLDKNGDWCGLKQLNLLFILEAASFTAEINEKDNTLTVVWGY